MNLVAKLNQHYDELAHKHSSPMLVEAARAIMHGYLTRWEREDAKTIVRGSEVPFCMELPVPDDLPDWSRPKAPRYIGGVIDSIIERDGRVLITDMKTATNPDDDYFKELYTNPQLTQYCFVLYACGFDKVSAEWDVVTKYTIKPKKLTKAMVSELESGTYAGWPVNLEVPEDGEETPTLFGYRLRSWYLDRPDHFMRRTFDRNERELLDFLYSSHEVQSQMETTVERGAGHIYSQRNHFACKSYGSLCEFAPICSGFDSSLLGFKTREKREGVPDTGVTPSQIGLFNQCRQKWWFRYQDRIEPVVRKRVDALDLGSLVHSGRELLLSSRLEKEIILPLALGSPTEISE